MGIDINILHFVNGNYSLFLDGFANTITYGWTWFVLYIFLGVMIVRNNKTMPQILLIFGCGILGILLAGGVNDAVIKPAFGRLRPCFDPEVSATVHIVKGFSASGYSFVSSHAANTFSLAMFFTLLTRSTLLSVSLFSWATINAWTRIYLGAHYFTDVLAGMILGLVVGAIVYVIYHKVFYRISPHVRYVSSHYTCTGYANGDIDACVVVIIITLMAALLKTIIFI